MSVFNLSEAPEPPKVENIVLLFLNYNLVDVSEQEQTRENIY